MNRKPVYWGPKGKILNLDSGFREKDLCDGPTFSTGLACAYSCAFCYVEGQMFRHPSAVQAKHDGHRFDEVVIRRTAALEALEEQLVTKRGQRRFPDPEDRRVVYASPLVDVAANMELARETAAVCNLILKHTSWQIRLLSKSNLLPVIAAHIPADHKRRMIFGVSTGTLDDRVAKAFEKGTPLVSKRISSIRELQDDGWRTFAMICPSLPLEGTEEMSPGEVAKVYRDFAARAGDALRYEKMEHVWAEVINVRGESMHRTHAALADAGLYALATQVLRVSNSTSDWEAYARATFEGHVAVVPRGRLRFLQYVTPSTAGWWRKRKTDGALLLGAAAHTSL